MCERFWKTGEQRVAYPVCSVFFSLRMEEVVVRGGAVASCSPLITSGQIFGISRVVERSCGRISLVPSVSGTKGAVASQLKHGVVPLPSKLWGASVKRRGGDHTQFQKYGGDQCKLRSGGTVVGPARCHKMFVPGFGEKSPEAKAAEALHNFFTYVAVKIVASQLQDYNEEAYADLMKFLDTVSLKDGDKFCAALLRESARHKNLALRIMEVRSAYANQDFEWENVKDLSLKHIEESNTALMRKFVIETSDMA